MNAREASRNRKTTETEVSLTLALDGAGAASVSTGVGFFDHMISSLARHSGFDLTLACDGDLEVDDHHTLEDCALVLGGALDEALGDRRGIARFGFAMAPMDEALARAVVDLSGRPFASVDLGLTGERLGSCGCANLEHALGSMATAARAAFHVDVLKGANDHHRAEAAFKALALALRQAVARTGADSVPSEKGVL